MIIIRPLDLIATTVQSLVGRTSNCARRELNCSRIRALRPRAGVKRGMRGERVNHNDTKGPRRTKRDGRTQMEGPSGFTGSSPVPRNSLTFLSLLGASWCPWCLGGKSPRLRRSEEARGLPPCAARELVAQLGGQLVLLGGHGVGQLFAQAGLEIVLLAQRAAQLD